MKKIVTFTVLLALCFSLCACGTPTASDSSIQQSQNPTAPQQTAQTNNSPVGYYTGNRYYYIESGNEYSIGGEKDSVTQLDLEIREDGTCIYFRDHKTYNGSWTYSKDTLYVNVSGIFNSYGTIKNGVLYLHDCPKGGYDSVLFLDGVEINEADIPHVYKPSMVERAYKEAHDISSSDCELLSNGNLLHKNPRTRNKTIIPENQFAIINGKPAFISKGALYYSWALAAALICADREHEHDSEFNVIYMTIDLKDETRAQSLDRLQNFCDLFSPNIEGEDLVKKFETLGVARITNNDDKTFEYEIDNLEKALNTLDIADDFLGYAISYIGGAVEFDENSMHATIYKHDLPATNS